jgi:hypothetical protein
MYEKQEEYENKKNELEHVKNTTKHQMWLSELEILKSEYLEYKEIRERLMNGEQQTSSSKIKKKVVSKGPLKSKANLAIE